ncbi:hypothetical protein P4V39_03410 [Brevibacillus borstelensis]|nr:hypothetical protein [Brevibacillus borstelensis]MCM3591405.1 hypothetical protein [Brevibacillus borstelensis]MED2007168.1 hypothetical protein [Brevibacillus borstelensis]
MAGMKTLGLSQKPRRTIRRRRQQGMALNRTRIRMALRCPKYLMYREIRM